MSADGKGTSNIAGLIDAPCVESRGVPVKAIVVAPEDADLIISDEKPAPKTTAPPPADKPKELKKEPQDDGSETRFRPAHLFKNSTVQLVLGSVGAVVVMFLWKTGEPPAAEKAMSRSRTSSFPKIEIEGAPPVTTAEVGRLLSREAASSPSSLPSEPQEGQPGAIKLTPGVMIDPDAPDIQARMRDFEVAQREHRKNAGSPSTVSSYAPRIESKPEAKKTSGPTGSAFFQPGGFLDIGKPQRFSEPEKTGLGLSVGYRFDAVLEIGVSSIARRVAIAKATRAFSKDGTSVVPEGAILKGYVSSDPERIQIEFVEIVTSEGTFPFHGYAVDGKMPGLISTRREATFEERQTAGFARGALNVLREATGAVGNVPGTVAKSVADETIPEAKNQVTPERGYVLEVGAGHKFQVVVTETK